MKRLMAYFVLLFVVAPAFAARVPDASGLNQIDQAVQQEIAVGHPPGAVVLIGGKMA